ncbi:bifunctional sugar phosphate isomerase/epimerase/4-hydroxyphenylpyruvate dioxygenase family protein [Novosphingobium terrae]|uniref:bifunctional sugar phosphate isomerase/epimerase/4-hydroxyphenylpyruvate dioxygenase family protein n=1 Tax=Novosphingobium terrae TaxID=2726189 RepID=UPI002AC32AAA|nr:TIM barrel protein [Novosphingobium terrae]
MEIFENDLLCAQQSAKEIGAICKDLGLAISMFQPFRDYEGLPRDLRDKAEERMRRKFQVMEDLDTDLILLCSNCSPHSSGQREQLLEDLAHIGRVAGEHGKRIAYEGLAWGLHVHDHRDAWALVRDVDHPALGLALDSFHSLARSIPSASIADVRADKLFIVQWADAPILQMDPLNWSRHFRCMPGQGDFDLTTYGAQLRRIGYDGYWSLEIFNDRFRAGSANQIARDGLRSLRTLHDRAGIVLGKRGELPVPIDPVGVEFIEFAASHAEARDFERIFHALGFAPAGRHRNKDVVRWRQGDINLVINSEPEGLAHSFDIVHGGSVCALGLAVDDQTSAIARAEALDIERFTQPIAPDEWQIPALRGIGGSLLYLVDAATRETMWEQEFPAPPTGGLSEHAAGRDDLVAIDHVAQTMHYEEFLSWLLFYTSLLDVSKTPLLEIADPMGIVYSQAVESRPDEQGRRALRFTLNGSLAANALSTRFLHHYFGAGVQHIAFQSRDIFATAAHAKEAGLPFLALGPNYYADLEARFDLSPDLVARMAEYNILYDRDGDGEYFQFYSRAIAKRIFFEVVERRTYDAYGATNATVRLNAQAVHRSSDEI